MRGAAFLQLLVSCATCAHHLSRLANVARHAMTSLFFCGLHKQNTWKQAAALVRSKRILSTDRKCSFSTCSNTISDLIITILTCISLFFLPRSSQQQRDTAHYKRRVWTVRPAKWGAWPSLSCGLSLKFLLLPVVAFTLRLGHAPVASIKTPLSIPSALAVRLCAAPAIQCQIVQSKGYGISISLRFDFNVELQCAFLGHSPFPTPNSSSSAFQHAKRMLQPFRRVRQYRAQMKHSQDQKCQSFRLIASLIFH